MDFRFSLRRAILDILHIKEQVYDKYKNNENYKPILDFLMAKDYLDDNIDIPSFIEMEKVLGIKMYHLRKRLKELYDDIFDYDHGIKFDFKEIEIHFYLSNNKKDHSFICTNLTYLPRVGDDFELPFVHAKLNTSSFYVDSISHCLQDGKQIIYIYLTGGYYNSYWKLRKDEAKMKREFSFNDLRELDEWDLKKKLGLW
ncbi:MAG: hypothetical protein Q8Q51_11530 [Lutibacter sp.]|nr:hypothetical protein [Lutibacter sp.]